MALQRLSINDIFHQLNKSGLGQGVKASQALEAFGLYIQGELPQIEKDQVEPLFVRHRALMVRTHVPAVAQLLKDHEEEITKYITDATGVQVDQLRFRA